APRALDELMTGHQNLYMAALPGYTSNFPRDGFTYGLLSDDLDSLSSQVRFAADHQGTKADAYTGEEPGKIHHEWPGFPMRGKVTTYNACDTTAMFLLAISRLAKRGDMDVLRTYSANIMSAIDYIDSHIIDGLFYEDTTQSGTDRFGVKVTYW